MISIDSMKWYHQLWFVPIVAIMLLVLTPFLLIYEIFKKK